MLKAANLDAETEKLDRAVSKLEYADMRGKIMKIFGDPGVLGDKGEVPGVKEEVFYGEDGVEEDIFYGEGYDKR